MKKIKCIKTLYTFVNDDNLIDNGIDPAEFKNNSYPLFEEGKSYFFVGPMEAISGNTIIYVESDLTLKHNNNKISEKFYVNEFDEKRVKEWETLFNSEKISLLKKLFGEEELSKFSKKPRNEKYILDYFDYNKKK
jgi:hypothetical protein